MDRSKSRARELIEHYNDEALSELVVDIDRNATRWAYNRHCKNCGRFLYPEEVEHCKKCKHAAVDHIKRAIPFLNSATAIEKLVIWIRDSLCEIDKPTSDKLLSDIEAKIVDWINSSRSASTYRLEIVIACINTLSKISS